MSEKDKQSTREALLVFEAYIAKLIKVVELPAAERVAAMKESREAVVTAIHRERHYE